MEYVFKKCVNNLHLLLGDPGGLVVHVEQDRQSPLPVVVVGLARVGGRVDGDEFEVHAQVVDGVFGTGVPVELCRSEAGGGLQHFESVGRGEACSGVADVEHVG